MNSYTAEQTKERQEYEKPVVEIFRFTEEDVITASEYRE